MSEVFLEKKIVRKEVKEAVKAFCLDQGKKAQAEELICKKVLSSDTYKGASLILAYSALNDEVDISALISRAFIDDKKIALPVVQGDTMNFYLVDSESTLKEGAFGIKEPLENEEKLITRKNIGINTIVLVPGRAFTKDGKRLGRGKGFYDKWFSSMGKEVKNLSKWGICFPCQLVENLPADEKDVPMDLVIFG